MSTEFQITLPNGEDRYFKKWDEACGLAVSIAASGKTVSIDVLCDSAADAKKFGIDDYDPEASVTARIEIKADNKGKVP